MKFDSLLDGGVIVYVRGAPIVVIIFLFPLMSVRLRLQKIETMPRRAMTAEHESSHFFYNGKFGSRRPLNRGGGVPILTSFWREFPPLELKREV